MSTIQAGLTNLFPVPKFSPVSIAFTSDAWDSSFIKKFATHKWPYELYKGSFFHDLALVFFSPVK